MPDMQRALVEYCSESVLLSRGFTQEWQEWMQSSARARGKKSIVRHSRGHLRSALNLTLLVDLTFVDDRLSAQH